MILFDFFSIFAKELGMDFNPSLNILRAHLKQTKQEANKAIKSSRGKQKYQLFKLKTILWKKTKLKKKKNPPSEY